MILLLALLFVLAAISASLALFSYRTARKVEAALPPKGRFVDVPGARLHYVERGQGPAVLLIHGLAGQLNHYTYGVMDALADSYRVVAVDRPGSGYSARVRNASAALDAQADALAALIDALQLQRPLVVGHSMGGAVALTLALRHPDKVAGLALLAPLSHLVQDIPLVFRSLLIAKPWVRRLVAWTLAVPLTIAKRDELLPIIFDPDPVPSDYGSRGGGLLALRPRHFVSASEDFVAIPAYLPTLMRSYCAMRLPVHILYGRSDRILDPQAQGAALAAQLPGAKLTLTEGGHMLPVTAPQRCAEFIRDAARDAFGTA